MLARILTEPRDGLIRRFRKLFQMLGSDMELMTTAIRETAKLALQRGTGARGLRAIVEEILEEPLFEISDGQTRKIFIISPAKVRGEETAISIGLPAIESRKPDQSTDLQSRSRRSFRR